METTSPVLSPSPSISHHALKFPKDYRRRSADVGGLHLALASAFAAAEVQLAAHDRDNSSSIPPSLDGREGNDQDYGDDDGDCADGYGYHPHARHPYHHHGHYSHHQQFGAQGQGWMGGEGGDVETMYAELLSDMYNETLNSLNDNSLDTTPPPVPENVRTRLIWQLDKWHFEPHKLPDEEVLACTLLLFEALFRVEGMEGVIPLSMDQITAFIHHLRRIYRHENKYHNFEHALDVLQATQSYLKSAGVVPSPTILFQPPGTRWVPKRKVTEGQVDVDNGSGQSLMATLGKRELFMLYVGAIGHDVAHPGFSNVFMKNAQAPLAILFNHGSALEHMHSHLLLALMRRHGFAPLLDDPQHGAHLRKLLKEAVLATDMGVHAEFMDRLQSVVRGEQMSLCARQVVLCQALLKNADISNPTRPFLVSKHWSSALIQEWTAQAHLETYYHLQPSVPVSTPPPSAASASPSAASSSASASSSQPSPPPPPPPDPIAEANSQIFFIKKFAKPLLELTERAVPEMGMYTRWCKANLRTWEGVRARVGREREREEREEREARERQRRKGHVALEEQRGQIPELGGEALNAAEVELVVDADPDADPEIESSASASLPPSSSASLQNSPVPPPLSPRLAHMHMHSQSQLQYHTAFPLTLPPHPLASYAYSLSRSNSHLNLNLNLHANTNSNSNTHSSASSSSGRSRSGRSHSNSNSNSTSGHGVSQTPSPALSVPDSPTTTEGSECRSAASSSYSLANSHSNSNSNSNSETSTALGAASHSASVLSFTHSIGIGGGTSANAATASLAIRAAGKVGSLRKKSQTGLNGGAMGGLGVSRLPPMPPLPPMMVGASLSTSSATGGGAGMERGSTSSSGAASPRILGPSLSLSANGTHGINGTSTNNLDASTSSLNGTSLDKTPKNKSSGNSNGSNAAKMNSFRFHTNSNSRSRASARNSWCASSLTALYANADVNGVGSSSSSSSTSTSAVGAAESPERPENPERPERPRRRAISPLPPGKESWLGASSSGLTEEQLEEGKDKGKDNDKDKGKDKDKEDVETTPTATRVATGMPSSSPGEGEGSGRTSPSPRPPLAPAPAPSLLVSSRVGTGGVKVQVLP